MDAFDQHTSRISKVGMWGRKSLPTKKHINTKSSIRRSKFILKGASTISKSFARYSRNTHMLRNCQQENIHSESTRVKDELQITSEANLLDQNGRIVQSTWYFFLWIGGSSTELSGWLGPLHSAAKCPTWPQRKHFSCCPGMEITCKVSWIL